MTGGPHHGPTYPKSFLVADAATTDKTASVRVAVWCCAPCGALLVGLGKTGPRLDGPPGTGVHVQEFTWLEESPVPLKDQPEEVKQGELDRRR